MLTGSSSHTREAARTCGGNSPLGARTLGKKRKANVQRVNQSSHYTDQCNAYHVERAGEQGGTGCSEGMRRKRGTPLTQAEYSFYSNYDMPVELGEGRKSSGGSFSWLSFGDIMRGTELAPFSKMYVCVSVCVCELGCGGGHGNRYSG